MKTTTLCAVGLLALCGVSSVASADINVQVGYADGIRNSGFFPNPWSGDPGITFVGFSESGQYDAGAVKIKNLGATPITINDVTVTIRSGISFDLWGSNTIAPGDSLIVTQTHDYNFDTSDFPSSPNGVVGGDIPQVDVTVDGVSSSFLDTGRVLNTNGYDFAYNLANESFAWRDISGDGTPGGPSVPEPGMVALLGSGAMTLGGLVLRRRKA